MSYKEKAKNPESKKLKEKGNKTLLKSPKKEQAFHN